MPRISLAAIHEASHCCLYRAFGIVLNGVRINSDGTGRVHRYNFEPPQAGVLANAQAGAIAVAGVIGEAIYENGDGEINAVLTKLQFGSGQGDYGKIQKCGVEPLVEALILFSRTVLTEHWSKVLGLATRLDEVQYLNSDEISSELPNVCDVARYSAQLKKAINNSDTK